MDPPGETCPKTKIQSISKIHLNFRNDPGQSDQMNSDETKSITVHCMGLDDLDAAARLFGGQFREHDIDTAAGPLGDVLRTIVKNPQFGFVLLATMGGQAIGAAYVAALLSLEHEGVIGWLEELYVVPEKRNGGVGTRLLSDVVERARDLGWKGIELELMAGHERAASVYQRHGFLPLSRSRFCRLFADCNEDAAKF